MHQEPKVRNRDYGRKLRTKIKHIKQQTTYHSRLIILIKVKLLLLSNKTGDSFSDVKQESYLMSSASCLILKLIKHKCQLQLIVKFKKQKSPLFSGL